MKIVFDTLLQGRSPEIIEKITQIMDFDIKIFTYYYNKTCWLLL